MTISRVRVLRDADGFSEATREKVLREVKHSDYLPNRIAAAFGPSSASTLISVSAPWLSNNFIGVVPVNIDHTFFKFGYQTIIGSHNQQVADEELMLKNIPVCGGLQVICYPVKITAREEHIEIT